MLDNKYMEEDVNLNVFLRSHGRKQTLTNEIRLNLRLLRDTKRYIRMVEVLQGLPSLSGLAAFQLEPSLECLGAISELIRCANHIISAGIRYQTSHFN